MNIKKGDVAVFPFRVVDMPNGVTVAPAVAPVVDSFLVNGESEQISGAEVVPQLDSNGSIVAGRYVLRVPTVDFSESDQVAVSVVVTPVKNEVVYRFSFVVDGIAPALSGIGFDGVGGAFSPSDQVVRVFTTSFAGQLVNADFTPVVNILGNGIDISVRASVQKIANGVYSFSFVVPAEPVSGVSYSALISAVIGGAVFERSVLLGTVSLLDQFVSEINSNTQPTC